MKRDSKGLPISQMWVRKTDRERFLDLVTLLDIEKNDLFRDMLITYLEANHDVIFKAMRAKITQPEVAE